ncbi:MAG: AbrB/MazE/SpoVT family DNA-binding domain-containing protein [Sulfuricella sp.]
MKTVKLSTKGQIVIPKNIRESHHLTAGTEFVIAFMGDEIRLKPIPVFPTTHAEEGMGILARKERKPLSDEETEFAIGEMFKEADKST